MKATKKLLLNPKRIPHLSIGPMSNFLMWLALLVVRGTWI
jgi:hypothetical protein